MKKIRRAESRPEERINSVTTGTNETGSQPYALATGPRVETTGSAGTVESQPSDRGPKNLAAPEWRQVDSTRRPRWSESGTRAGALDGSTGAETLARVLSA
jgi:hypothetical protein